MQSVTSFFNHALWRKNLQRFWPLWALYALVWLLLVPVYLLSQLSDRYYASYATALKTADVSRIFLEMGAYAGLIMAVIFGIFFAMALFSYLMNPRATQGLHALPIRREALYATNCATLFALMFSAPILAYLLGALIAALFGLLDLAALATGLAAALLAATFFSSFAVFCMMFTGQLLAAPVFYGILNVLAVGMEYVVRCFAGNFLFGFADSFNQLYLAPLSPVYLMVTTLDVSRVTETQLVGNEWESIALDLYEMEGMGCLLAYAIVGIVLLALGFLVYRRRASEMSGSTVTVSWARPVFKYGVATCMALTLGQLVYYLLFGIDLSQGEYSLAGTLVCMLLAGLLGYFAAEMLLKKSFRVWRTGARGALVFSAVLLLFGFTMSLDPVGYERYVPEPDEIASVYLQLSSYGVDLHIDLDDAESIALATGAHRALIADKSRQLAHMSAPRNDSNESYLSFRVSYLLKDGSTLARRYYDCTVFIDELLDPDSLTSRMTALVNCPEAARDRARSTLWDGSRTVTGGVFRMWRYTENGTEREEDLELTGEQARAVAEALRQDYLSGNTARESLFTSHSQNAKNGDWYDFTLYLWHYETGESVSANTHIDLTSNLTHTLATLRSFGANIPALG